MDLFHMKRYWSGDDDTENEEPKDEKEIIKELNEKLTKRKAAPSDKPELQDDAEDEPKESKEPPKKKRKKKKESGPTNTGFTVLGEDLFQRKEKVHRVLPNWLANPNIVSVDLGDQQMKVEELKGLDEITVKKLTENKVKYFFPVQRQVIPWLLDSVMRLYYRPSDICVSAPTGSGKTLAFVLPIVQALRDRVVPRVRALVILPVQDLAVQVFKVFQTYCEGTELKVKLITGQKSFAQEQQELVREGIVSFHSLVDIVVATPGRLVDHIQRTEGFSLEALRFLVIDEADRVMDDIQNDWLNHVEAAVYCGERQRPGPITVANANKMELPLQKLLFSATLSQNPEKLEQMNLYEPKLFTSVVQPKDILHQKNDEFLGKYTTPMELTEKLVVCKDPMKKPLYLKHLIGSLKMEKALVFTNSIENAHFLCILLKEFGLDVAELSSKVGDHRTKVLRQFREGSTQLLVATDALARGIDIGRIDFVVSYDVPPFVKTYIHRVGRTARAGQQGTAITIATEKELRKFNGLLKEAGKDSAEQMAVSEEDLDEKSYEEARGRAREVLMKEKQAKSDKMPSRKKKMANKSKKKKKS